MLKNTKYIFLVMLGLFIMSYFIKDQLPRKSNIAPTILQVPIQKNIDKQVKKVHYHGSNYQVELVNSYEINGLLVSKNNPKGWFDVYHDEKSFDTKDFCLIWGKNITDIDYSKVDFWNVSITCRWKFSRGNIVNNDYISNNHLITDKPEIRKKIDAIQIGDQIRIKGYLANYSKDEQNFKRKTSLTRTDTGMGSCEVIFVEELEILKENKKTITIIFNALKYILPLFLIFMFYSWYKEV